MKEFIGHEKESLVTPDRSAKRSTQLTTIQPGNITAASRYRSRRTVGEVKKVLGIQVAIADKFESFTVKPVGSALEHDIDLRSAASSKLGGVGAGLDFKLLDGVGHGQYAVLVDHQVLVVDTIEQEIVGRLASAVD